MVEVLSSSLDSTLIPSRFGLSLTVEDMNAEVFSFRINLKIFVTKIRKLLQLTLFVI